MQGEILFLCVTVFTAGFAIAIGVIFPALGQGKACSKALEGIARQPEATDQSVEHCLSVLLYLNP